jgi:hypothetical protein
MRIYELFKKHGYPIVLCRWINDGLQYGADPGNRMLYIRVYNPARPYIEDYYFKSFWQAAWAVTNNRMSDFYREM